MLTERHTQLGRITVAIVGLWGIFIGVFAQGLGYLLSTRNSIIAGVPGSGLLTTALAVLLLLPSRQWRSPKFLFWCRRIWLALFGFGTLWQLRFFTPKRLQTLYAAPPALWRHDTVYALGTFSYHHPIVMNSLWMLGLAALAALALSPWMGHSLLTLLAASGILIAIWWFGQDFGLMAGFGLSLNTAPLWGITLWALYWPTTGSKPPLGSP